MSNPDPRDDSRHPIRVGQIYGLARTKNEDSDGNVTYGEHVRVVYQDDERVLARSSRSFDNINGKAYLGERRQLFEDAAAEGFYMLLEDSDKQLPLDRDGIVDALKVVKRYRHRLNSEAEQGGGRKAQHKLEAIEELVEELEKIPIDTGVVAPESEDWTVVSGVGEHTAAALHEDGVLEKADVLRASDEKLLKLSGVGEGNMANLREYASED